MNPISEEEKKVFQFSKDPVNNKRFQLIALDAHRHTLNRQDLFHTTVKLMELAENEKDASGEEKKKMVLGASEHILKSDIMTDINTIQQLLKDLNDILPVVVNLFVDISNGVYNIGQVVSTGIQKSSCLTSCCSTQK